MAENEILDFGGRRWQRSRAALASPNLSLTAIAACIGDELNRAIHLQLSKALRGGQPLHDILRATESNPAAARAAVQSFQDQGLGQIVLNAIKIAASRDPSAIANCATDLLLRAIKDRASVNAGRCDSFQQPHQRQALNKAIEVELESRRSGIAATIAASLRGQPALRLRRNISQQPSTPRTAATLVNVSLGIRPREGANGQRHG